MRSSTLDRASLDSPPRLTARWVGVLAGPLVWATLLETNYALSYVACEQRHNWMLHLVTVAAVALVALRRSPPGARRRRSVITSCLPRILTRRRSTAPGS